MAHQDYVSRSRTPKKKNNPYNKKAKAAPEGLPTKVKIIALLALAAIAFFAYFLWSIKDKQPEPQLQTPAVVKTTSSANSSALPALPKEKWDYVEGLKNKKVEVGKYEVVNKGPYQMQCGSFRTKEQAEVLKARIAFVGISAQIRESKGKSGIWHRIVLGPYGKKRQAEKDKHKLKNNNINGCQIWGWQ